MFSFKNYKKSIEARKYLARICNLATPNYAVPSEAERTENRHNRSIPTLICPGMEEQTVR